MTLDGLLTFLGLAVAVYAVLPPMGRLRIQLQLALQLVLAFLAIALVFYLEFFEFISLPCLEPLGNVCSWMVFHSGSQFTPDKAAFLVVCLWMLLSGGVFLWLPASARALGQIATLLEHLLYQERYGEVVDFVRPHLKLIERASKGELGFQRFTDWIYGKQPFDLELWLADRLDGTKRSRSRLSKGLSGCLRPFLFLLPSAQRASESASLIIHSIYFSGGLLEYIARQRPGFAGDLVRVDIRERFYFSDQFLHHLIARPTERLYEEIRRNLEHGALGSYDVDNRNPILRTYFSDARIAVQLAAWKPVGNFALETIRDPDRQRLAFLNGSRSNFAVERWAEPVYIAIEYLNIAVRSAVSQSIKDDMYLSYLAHFIDALLDIYDDQAEGADENQEFPNRAAELIYEAVSTMCAWVDLFHSQKPGSPHRQIPDSMHHGTASIPAAAARNLGEATKAIALSTRIGKNLGSLLLEMILGAVKKLVHGEEEARFRAFVIGAIIYPSGEKCDDHYGKRLAGLVRSVDSFLLYDLKDFTAAFGKAFPNVEI